MSREEFGICWTSRHERELDMAVDKMLLYCSRQKFKEDSTQFLAANNGRTPLEIRKRYVRYLSFTDGEFSKTGVVEKQSTCDNI